MGRGDRGLIARSTERLAGRIWFARELQSRSRGPDMWAGLRSPPRFGVLERGDESFVDAHPNSGLVAEHNPTVGILLVNRNAKRRTDVLNLGGQVIWHCRGSVSDRGVRREADRANGQISAVCRHRHAQKVRHTPGCGSLDDVYAARVEMWSILFQASEVLSGSHRSAY